VALVLAAAVAAAVLEGIALLCLVNLLAGGLLLNLHFLLLLELRTPLLLALEARGVILQGPQGQTVEILFLGL
jgi:hypothetical protein